tara:strand:- start:6 stop:221 length:216 start_codon:yes stop_codon:yes gene_type:complete
LIYRDENLPKLHQCIGKYYKVEYNGGELHHTCTAYGVFTATTHIGTAMLLFDDGNLIIPATKLISMEASER